MAVITFNTYVLILRPYPHRSSGRNLRLWLGVTINFFCKSSLSPFTFILFYFIFFASLKGRSERCEDISSAHQGVFPSESKESRTVSFFYEYDASVRSLTWENSRHFATLPLVSLRNDVWETSVEIPYWWCVTTKIWVVLLIGRALRETCFHQ